MTTATPDEQELMRALSEPFDSTEVKWKPGVVSGNRCMALAYIDARVVQDRLDDVLGVTNWQDEYAFLPDGACTCKLSVRIGGEWLCKMDVGSESEQPDEGDRHKAAVSDALKRTAIKFGIGRYLYRLGQQWVDYDPVKKKIAGKCELPAWAKQQPVIGIAAQKWKSWLAQNPSLESLNEYIRKEIPELEVDDKKAVWPLVLHYARGRGWIFDDANKLFIASKGAAVSGGAKA